tara:strand:- start:2 stop:274 length:273 start_codon:yes stop_codon:yes gene_type:complete
MYHQSYLDGLSSQDYEEFLFWSGQISRKPLDNGPPMEYNTHMDELEYDYADDPFERSDDYNVFEERELDLDEELDYDYDRDEAPDYDTPF